MDRSKLLKMCETQIFSFEEFKNFDQQQDASQVNDKPMEVVVAYGQFKLFLDLKDHAEKAAESALDYDHLVAWLQERAKSSNIEGFTFTENSAHKVKNSEPAIRNAYADWDAANTILALFLKNPHFCAITTDTEFP